MYAHIRRINIWNVYKENFKKKKKQLQFSSLFYLRLWTGHTLNMHFSNVDRTQHTVYFCSCILKYIRIERKKYKNKIEVNKFINLIFFEFIHSLYSSVLALPMNIHILLRSPTSFNYNTYNTKCDVFKNVPICSVCSFCCCCCCFVVVEVEVVE
jgi:hypothetical protein